MTGFENTRFWRRAIRSGLIDGPTLEACLAQIEPEKRSIEAIDRRLARVVVRSGAMTAWQARQVYHGRADSLKIDRYLLWDILGRGGMGTVFLAEDRVAGGWFALKMMRRVRDDEARARVRFDREIRIGLRLEHENVVRVLGHGRASGCRYLVMEYIDGPTIAELTSRSGRVAPPIAAEIGRQLALGLEEMARWGLLHRDIKPSNVLLTRSGVAKLSDLGLAFDLNRPGVLTREGSAIGTLQYTSPEQARDSRDVDIRGDIYSLGCTLYHMIAGHAPFPDLSLAELVLAHQTARPAPLADLEPGCPRGLAEVVARMLAKDPTARYAQPRDVAEALAPHAIARAGLGWIVPGSLGAPGYVEPPGENRPILAEWFEKTLPAASPPSNAPRPGLDTREGDLFLVEESDNDLVFPVTDAELPTGRFASWRARRAGSILLALLLLALILWITRPS